MKMDEILAQLFEKIIEEEKQKIANIKKDKLRIQKEIIDANKSLKKKIRSYNILLGKPIVKKDKKAKENKDENP